MLEDSRTISRYRLRLETVTESGWPPIPSHDHRRLAQLLRELVFGQPREVIGALFLDTQLDIFGSTIAYRGSLDRVGLEPRGFFAPALLANAAKLMLFHNHPSNNCHPSLQDLATTGRLCDAGEVLGIEVTDHLIISRYGVVASFWTQLRWYREGRRLLEQQDQAAHPLGNLDGRRRVKPKYRHPDNPDLTWAGRGSMARWLTDELEAGRDLAQFRVEE